MSANITQYMSAFRESQALVDTLEIKKYPVKILQIYKRIVNPCVLVSTFADYKVWASSMGWPCPDELKDAKCYYRPSDDVYIVIYNENKPDNRIRFSLAHELGHIVLGHLNDERTEICRGGLDDVTYYIMEGAANTFAGNFLAPPILIRERIKGGQFDVSNIANFFHMSEAAVRTYRKDDYTYWLKLTPSAYEQRILKRCKKWLFPRTCTKCHSVTYDTSAKHCFTCGAVLSKDFRKTGEKMMKYPGIELDAFSRAAECPVCRNTDLPDGGNICIICGTSLVNYCSDDDPFGGCSHDEPLPGNARFCPHCGSKSTFFVRGVLKAWNYKEDELELLDDDNGELPF